MSTNGYHPEPVSLQEVLGRLQGVKRSRGGYIAQCPAHDDRHPSLSISEGKDGRVLLKCFAGCSTEEVVRALGLEMRDLFPSPVQKNGKREVLQRTEYVYQDAEGKPYMKVVRGPGKQFRQYRYEAGKWLPGLQGREPVLYRLPEVLEAISKGRGIWIVEGEKDVHTLERLGLVATCNPMGAGKWRDSYTESLQGARQVYVIPDADAPGVRHALEVARSLYEAGIPVRILEPLGEPGSKEDVSDRLDLTTEDLKRMAREAGPFTGEPPEWVAKYLEEDARGSQAPLLIERASAVDPRPIEWLWPERIARGKYHLIAGIPGLGKSQLTVSLIATVTRGGTWPDGSGQAPLGRALILSAEDDPRDTIVPRLMAAGADRDRVDIIRAVPAPGGRERHFSLLEDLERLRQAITPEHRLLIIDPITAYLGTGQVDTHRTADVRGVLSPLQRLAEDTGLAVVAISHLNKQGAGSAMSRITGSHAFTAAARIVYLVAPHPEEEHLRLFLPVKINIAEMPRGLAFEIQGIEVGEGIQTSRLLWLPGEEVPWGADEVLSMSRGPRQGQKLQEAQEWLREILRKGPRPARDIFRLGEDAGFSRRTLYRAKEALKVESRRTGFQGGFSWMLPNDCQVPSNDCQASEQNLRNSANFPMMANDALKGKVGNHWENEALHPDENLTLEYPDEPPEPPF